MKFKDKTNREFEEIARLANSEKRVLFGIKGPTPFSRFLTIPEQVTFDYLHLILQGHTKWMIN